MSRNLPKSWGKRLEKLTHTCGCNQCEAPPEGVSQFIEDLKELHQANDRLQVARLLGKHLFTLDEALERLNKE